MAQIKDLERMCKSHGGCLKCGVYKAYETCGVCFLPDNLDEIVDKWVEEHPVKTYAMDFFEKFPNARKNDIGTPTICVKCVYGELSRDCARLDCNDCWNREMKENA